MTTADEIRQWIQEWEGPFLDFKDSRILGNPQHLAKIMVAFANTQGGRIIIGVRDDRTFEGLPADPAHQSHVHNIARNNIDPPLNIAFENLNINGNDLYVITVPRFTTYPHALKTAGGKVYYIRIGDSIREPSPQEMTILFSGSPQNILSEIRVLHDRIENIQNQLNQILQRTRPSQDISARENVIQLIRTFMARWTNFVNAPVESQVGINLDELQIFLRNAGDRLVVAATTAFGGQSDEFTATVEFGGRLRRLGEKEFYINGGKSWKEFLDEGNDLIQTGQKIISMLGDK